MDGHGGILGLRSFYWHLNDYVELTICVVIVNDKNHERILTGESIKVLIFVFL